jgi:hypothetical protein
VIDFGALEFVPGAFIDADHASGMASDAAVGEEIGRVGEDEVDGGFGNGGEDFEAIALVEADVVFGVVVDDVILQFFQDKRELWGGIGHGRGVDQMGSTSRAT